jgi:hypothetical protein
VVRVSDASDPWSKNFIHLVVSGWNILYWVWCVFCTVFLSLLSIWFWVCMYPVNVDLLLDNFVMLDLMKFLWACDRTLSVVFDLFLSYILLIKNHSFCHCYICLRKSVQFLNLGIMYCLFFSLTEICHQVQHPWKQTMVQCIWNLSSGTDWWLLKKSDLPFTPFLQVLWIGICLVLHKKTEIKINGKLVRTAIQESDNTTVNHNSVIQKLKSVMHGYRFLIWE